MEGSGTLFLYLYFIIVLSLYVSESFQGNKEKGHRLSPQHAHIAPIDVERLEALATPSGFVSLGHYTLLVQKMSSKNE